MLNELEWQFNLAMRRLVHGRDHEISGLSDVERVYLSAVMGPEGQPVTFEAFCNALGQCVKANAVDARPPDAIIPASMLDKPDEMARAISGNVVKIISIPHVPGQPRPYAKRA